MAQFGAAEGFGMQPASLFELQRDFLSRPQAQSPADHIQVRSRLERCEGRRPVECPTALHEGRQRVERRLQTRIACPGGNHASQCGERCEVGLGFGSVLNLNVHFHMLIPDGVYLTDAERPVFSRVAAPTPRELQALVQQISERLGRHLERQGILVRDAESSHLAFEPEGEEGALADLQGHSISYRIALGPQRGRKAFLLQSVAPAAGSMSTERVAQACGFSLHAGVAAEAEQREKLERPRRHQPRDLRAAGFACPPGRPGANPRGESDPLPRSVRAESPLTSVDRAVAARARGDRQQGRVVQRTSTSQ
jgi:hypothetical protein